MSFRVEQKVGNNIYVYEATSYWDKEKKQSRQKRKFIGKKDKITGKLITTENKGKSRPVKSVDFGNTFFLKKIAEKSGLADIVNEIVPGDSKALLTLVQYIISESNAYYLAGEWSGNSYVEASPKEISSQRISELLERIGSDTAIKTEFFRKWIKRQGEIGAIYFDITSISTYSRLLDLAEWGYNRDREKLPQLNLGMIYGEKNDMPLYYTIYQGSIADITTLKNAIKFNKIIGIKKVRYILDRGFYSKQNIERLNGEKVLIPLPLRINLSGILLKKSEKKLGNINNMFMFLDKVYYYSKKTVEISGEEFTAHIYRDKQRYNEEETAFLKLLLEIENKINKTEYEKEEDITEGIEAIAHGYSKYYDIISKSDRFYIKRDTEAIKEKTIKFGTFILISNMYSKSKERLLELYKRRDRIEKTFDTMKNDLAEKRLRVNKRERAEGTLFIIFLALITSSCIEKILKKSGKLKNYTKKQLIYELKNLKLIQFANGSNILTEVSKKVRNIFRESNITLPSD